MLNVISSEQRLVLAASNKRKQMWNNWMQADGENGGGSKRGRKEKPNVNMLISDSE
jgi:hypothetical protein